MVECRVKVGRNNAIKYPSLAYLCRHSGGYLLQERAVEDGLVGGYLRRTMRG